MHTRSMRIRETLSVSEKNMIKDMKRDLAKFIPLFNRMTRRKAKELEQSELNNMSCDYAKTYDHMVPTISFKNK